MLRDLVVEIEELYAEVDQSVNNFRRVSGLACTPGCVECCYSEKVEATVLEMIPAAVELHSLNQAELILKRLEREIGKTCILFRPDLSSPEGGGCTMYEKRALICRLFGFAGNRDREGRVRLAYCKHMRGAALQRSEYDTSADGEAGEEMLPLFQTFGLRLTTIAPQFGTIRQPVNSALYEALVKVGLLLSMEDSLDGKAGNDGTEPREPEFPPVGGQRKAA